MHLSLAKLLIYTHSWIKKSLNYFAATANKDYYGLPKAFYLASGEFLSCYNISIVDDDELEGKEIIILTLRAPTGFTGVIVSRSQSVLEITDNDKGMVSQQ